MITLALQHGWSSGVLLGLGSGTLLWRFVTEVPDLQIVGVDHFIRRDRHAKVSAMASSAADRCTVHAMRTAQAATLIEDGSVDFVLIDAGHKHGCVRSDIRRYWSKVKTGGWFGGRGYDPAHPGVVTAVNERFDDPSFLGYSVWSVEKT